MISLGFSTCPNDTFIFDALVHNKTAHPFQLELNLADVDELNIWAQNQRLDISKISFGAYPSISKNYQILDSGSALGFGCGPLLISKNKQLDLNKIPNDFKVAIPGLKTTANLLLSICLPQIKNKKVMLFSEIEDAVLHGDVDAGLIIHENRFTYQLKGLSKLADLGELWEKRTGYPIPLGCIAVKRTLPEGEKLRIQNAIKESIEFAFNNPSESKNYITQHAQELDPEVVQQHIDLYVNKFSISLGEEGAKAIEMLFEEGIKAGIFEKPVMPIFLGGS